MKKVTTLNSTPLVEILDLKERYRLGGVYVKDESKNPFGTIKDVRNLHILQEAIRFKVDKLILITSGNNGYSLAQLARGSRIKVICVVNRNLPKKTTELLRKVADKVIELDLDYKILHSEELVALARKKDDEVIWDVTNGYEDNYIKVFNEILKEVKPDYLIVPVGSGGIYLSMIQAVEIANLPTKVIGVGVKNTSLSVADKLSTPWTPYSKVLDHYHVIGHSIYRLSEEEVRTNYQTFKKIIDCEPSSSVIFAAFQKHSFLPTDVVVFLNSGKMNVPGPSRKIKNR